MRLASLPMYDLKALRPVTDAWWSALAAAFRKAGVSEVPAALVHGPPLHRHWTDPRLLFSQTCGYPLVHSLKGAVTLVATPAYKAPGCEGPYYRSLILVRERETAVSLADMAGRICGYNSNDSQSGYNALRHMVAPLAEGRPFFGGTLETGGHLASLGALQSGRVDLVAVDCVTHALAARHSPSAVAGLRVLTASESAPALPFVTRAGEEAGVVERLRAALRAVAADPVFKELRQALLLDDIVALPEEAYGVIRRMEEEARSLGYPELA